MSEFNEAWTFRDGRFIHNSQSTIHYANGRFLINHQQSTINN